MATATDVFTEFREDHRKVRDTLFALKAAFEARDPARAREVLGRLNELTGPHFRYEEESLYPALKPILGRYVDRMIEDHDGAIQLARKLVELVGKESFTDEDVRTGVEAVQTILPHVSDCDGLLIFVETFDRPTIDRINTNIDECRAAGLPLLEWAETVRKK
ncbi:MAG TPA: hemerythrin domain-containing protein [Dehalococcoidia bacterium]|nr:hemerythrin domain-containing protein [Dehalococcoidia bacterium]